MKQNFTVTFSYLLYFAIAVFIHPAKNSAALRGDMSFKKLNNQEVAVAVENTGILHSELLFKF